MELTQVTAIITAPPPPSKKEKKKETCAGNSHHENLPKNNLIILVGPSSNVSRVQGSTSDKTKKPVQGAPVITTRQNITQKNKVGPSSTHPPSLKKLVQRTPIKNILPKTYSKNLSWTKLHPPTEFELCAT